MPPDARGVKLVVLDEGDKMLCPKDQKISEMLARFPKGIQVTMVSATLPTEVLAAAKNFMHDPVKVLESIELSLEGIKQFHITVGKRAGKPEVLRLDVLCELYDRLNISQVRFLSVEVDVCACACECESERERAEKERESERERASGQGTFCLHTRHVDQRVCCFIAVASVRAY
jgi:superfamily II DNA/RNA helicase